MCSSVAAPLLTSCPENTSAWVCTLFILIPWLSSSSNPWPSFCSQLNPSFISSTYFHSSASRPCCILGQLSILGLATPVIAQMPNEVLASPHSPQFAIQLPPSGFSASCQASPPGRPPDLNNCFSPVPPSKNGVSDSWQLGLGACPHHLFCAHSLG